MLVEPKPFYHLKSLFLFLPLLGLLSCNPKQEMPTDAAARATGKYPVQSYIVDGDTIFSTQGINKLAVSNFYVEVTRVESNKVLVSKHYVQNNKPCEMGKYAQVEETDGIFRLTDDAKAPSVYESTIKEGMFYERSVGMNVDSLMARLALDSLKSPYIPPYREIIVLAY